MTQLVSSCIHVNLQIEVRQYLHTLSLSCTLVEIMVGANRSILVISRQSASYIYFQDDAGMLVYRFEPRYFGLNVA